ncbi:MAG: GNAT family N-acetyltransferase [Deltaproteobacteria bacterium]|nr:GNAT family N-acetyltransferase [Deltaproteobacteria bacterium]
MTTSRDIRRARMDDVPALQQFFQQSYGPDTVFKSADFLQWFLGGVSSVDTSSPELLNAYVALDGARVVAHYGYIPTRLRVGGSEVPHVWGVNAYTLPEVRGEGLGRKLVDVVRAQFESFGVIGFSSSTADFYASLGFNVFEKRRFRRHVLVLQPEIADIVALIGTTEHPGAEKLTRMASLPHTTAAASTADPDSWIDAVPSALEAICSPVRDRAWLRWRFSPRSLLDYQTRYLVSSLVDRAMIAFRTVALPPTRHVMTRVVDLFGDLASSRALLLETCLRARDAGHIYVELSSMGSLYDELLQELGFVLLEDDEQSCLPLLTSPVAFKSNTEYVGLSSRGDDPLTRSLRSESVYFTSADSDRDRRGRLAAG